jgi:hypothetical protein
MTIWMDVDTAVQVPVSKMPLVDKTDFVTIEDAIAYNESGMAVAWNFCTTAGVMTTTAITPTTGDDHDWLEEGANQGMYSIEIPASGGDANNDTEGFGWITGETDSTLPFAGPEIGFRVAGLNALMIDDAFSATRGLAGTALPAVVADGAGGLPISDAGGLDLDTKLAATNEVTAARMGALTDWINGGRLDLLLDAIKAKTDSLTFTVANKIDTNVLAWLDTAVQATTAGIPDINIEAIDNDTIAANQLGRWAASGLRNGTADSGTTTTMVDAAFTTGDGSFVSGTIVFGSGGDGSNERLFRLITAFDAASDTLTFTPALPAAVTTEFYHIIPSGRVDVGAWLGGIPPDSGVAGVASVNINDVRSLAWAIMRLLPPQATSRVPSDKR